MIKRGRVEQLGDTDWIGRRTVMPVVDTLNEDVMQWC